MFQLPWANLSPLINSGSPMVEMNRNVNGGIKGTTMDDRWLTEHWVALESCPDVRIVDFNECIVLTDSKDELTILLQFILTTTGTYWTISCYFCEVNLAKGQRLSSCIARYSYHRYVSLSIRTTGNLTVWVCGGEYTSIKLLVVINL